ncbi:MAG: hypothetical protein ABJN26_09695 [Stappiaceae bacterium]
MKKIFGILIVSLFAATTAYAATFAEADVDANGTVSKAEAATAISGLTEEVFIAADADGDGELSEAEFASIPQ